MVRTQVQLTELQYQALKQASEREGCSLAELVRQAVDAFLARPQPPSREQVVARAKALVGRFRSNLGDLAEQHDRYLFDEHQS